MRIKEVIVVEGRNDTIKIQQAVEADTIETGGSALNAEVLERIRLAQERRGVIILTDPDYPGEAIRQQISQAVPGCRHAFIPREQALATSGKCGVEHAQVEVIRQALKEARRVKERAESEVSWEQLVSSGLVGGNRAKVMRGKMGQQLGIGYGNAKQFYKRLHMFAITRAEFEAALQQVLKEVPPA
ncbi:ribonuclease M5 [Caldalkalibacillus uzonensis]|uniref:Ribonuclease M5 n=1 Tax=Caldalkalibacillus uzonensis TaxID=353224 RepID=A0ABU0CW26_9BACI|nr:ribonuclease M5 [Caldalkalibacillus uzonensis]MDQ0340627.1 ribonuclease M5 [Caldalkalibacillus uzonensis]